MSKHLALYAFCVLIGQPAVSQGQRGVVFGTVVSSTGIPQQNTRFWFPGAVQLSITDEAGRYRVDVLPGRYTVRVLDLNGRSTEQEILVRAGTKTMVDWLGGQDGQDARAMNREDVRPSGSNDLIPMDSVRVVYHPKIGPVEWKSLDLTVRYELVEVSDSVRVSVMAEGKNRTKGTITTCGCLSFWDVTYGWGPERMGGIPLGAPPGWKPPGPSLTVAPQDCSAPELDAAPVRLAPGERFTRTMSFSFRPEDFREKTGELHIHSFYFTGKQGSPWEDVERVDLGIIAVPIRPPGMPARYKI